MFTLAVLTGEIRLFYLSLFSLTFTFEFFLYIFHLGQFLFLWVSCVA